MITLILYMLYFVFNIFVWIFTFSFKLVFWLFVSMFKALFWPFIVFKKRKVKRDEFWLKLGIATAINDICRGIR